MFLYDLQKPFKKRTKIFPNTRRAIRKRTSACTLWLPTVRTPIIYLMETRNARLDAVFGVSGDVCTNHSIPAPFLRICRRTPPNRTSAVLTGQLRDTRPPRSGLQCDEKGPRRGKTRDTRNRSDVFGLQPVDIALRHQLLRAGVFSRLTSSLKWASPSYQMEMLSRRGRKYRESRSTLKNAVCLKTDWFNSEQFR